MSGRLPSSLSSVTSLQRDFAGFLVRDAHLGRDRDDLGIEATCGLRGGGARCDLQRIFVLRLAADAVALGDHLGGVEHRHVDVGCIASSSMSGPRRISGSGPAMIAFDAAGDDNVHAVDDDLLGGRGDGHQARRALAVDGHAGDGDRQAGAQCGRAADGRLHALLERGADDAVVDLGGVDPGALDRGADGVGGERRRRAWR